MSSHARATLADDGAHLQLPGPETRLEVVAPVLRDMARLVTAIDAALSRH